MARKMLFPCLIGLLACAMSVVATAQVEYIDPGPGFTQVVTTTNDGVKTIFVSGQVGRGDTLREHVESAFAGVVRRLGQAGAAPADVVKIRIFVKDFEPAQYPTVAEVRLATFPEEDQWPASTMVGVRALAAESLRVEIEAIAVVAEPGVELEIERFAPSNGFSGAVAVHGARREDGLRRRTDSWRRLPGGADGGGVGARRPAARRGGRVARGSREGHDLHRRLQPGDGPAGVPRGPRPGAGPRRHAGEHAIGHPGPGWRAVPDRDRRPSRWWAWMATPWNGSSSIRPPASRRR